MNKVGAERFLSLDFEKEAFGPTFIRPRTSDPMNPVTSDRAKRRIGGITQPSPLLPQYIYINIWSHCTNGKCNVFYITSAIERTDLGEWSR